MLRRTGNWKTLAAVEDHKSAPAQLQLFWDRFRLLRPNHEIFELEKTGGVVLERTLPMMLHGDEGRSKKRQGVLCISCHSVLGRGVQTRKKKESCSNAGNAANELHWGNPLYKIPVVRTPEVLLRPD